MATAPLLPELNGNSPLTLNVKVGAALWAVCLSPAAVRTLEDRSANEINVDLDRVMESVRRKAVALYRYGGGSLSLDADDIAPPVVTMVAAEAPVVESPQWYSLISDTADDLI